MTPTLAGRMQTRLVLLSSIGIAWTLVVTPLLPRPAGMPAAHAYRVTLESAIAIMLLGLPWELVYHGLQQFRWDKDWPTILGLVTAVSEAVLVWIVLHLLGIVPGTWAPSSTILPLFATHFATTWLLVWLVSQGPLRVIVLCWRFEGGAFSRSPPDYMAPMVVSHIGTIIALTGLWFAWR